MDLALDLKNTVSSRDDQTDVCLLSSSAASLRKTQFHHIWFYTATLVDSMAHLDFNVGFHAPTSLANSCRQ